MITSGSLIAGAIADAFDKAAAAEAERNERLPTFREFLESEQFAAPYMRAVGISPVVGAIVDASEGQPVTTLTDDECLEVFKLRRDELPAGDGPRIVVVNAGRQAGKTSNLLAPKCVHAAWTQPAPNLRPGQVARCVIISPKVDQSKAAFRYCRGIIDSSPRLRRNVVKMTSGNLANSTDEVIILRRPDGHHVEIVVGAADSGGTAARSSTLLFAGFDEVAFFFADDGHTVNDATIFEAAMGTLRNLPGAQLWMVSTPWIDGDGLMEKLIAEHWGVRDGVLVAARVSSYRLRGRPDDGSLREDTDTDETYRREVLAIPLPKGSQGFFNAAALARALLRKPPDGPPEAKGAGADLAFERDCAAVAVMERFLGGLFAPELVEERTATPGDVEAATATVREFGALIFAAGVQQLMADHWKRTFAREHLHAEGIAFVDAPGSDEGKAKTFGAMKRIVDEDRFCLGHLPRRVAEYVRDQLRAVVATPLPGPGGRFRISSPRTKRLLEGVGANKIGAHGDVAHALVLAAWQAGSWQTAKAWAKRRQPDHVRRENAPPPAARPGASGSIDYLRSRSAGVGQRRVSAHPFGDDD